MAGPIAGREPSNSRRHPRIEEVFPVQVAFEATGESLTGEAVNLSPFGIKVRCEPIPAPAIVRLTFELPVGGPSLSLAAVAVRTDPDGTAFAFINLPRDDLHRLAHAVESLALRRKFWIIVVEDDPDVAEVLADLIEEQGYAAIVVRRAEDALAYLQQDQPDAILLDVALPGMSGLAFLDRLAHQERHIPVIVVSGVEEETGAVSLRAGALDFIPKPVDFEHFRRVLGALELASMKHRLQHIHLVRALALHD
jgi:CheY-like chemotaxis protein